jgi:threonine dehydratase
VFVPTTAPAGKVARLGQLGARVVQVGSEYAEAYAAAVAAGVASVLVSDQATVDARRRLLADHRIVVEHGTAAALAALTSGAYRPAPGERVVVLLCGANTDPGDLT